MWFDGTPEYFAQDLINTEMLRRQSELAGLGELPGSTSYVDNFVHFWQVRGGHVGCAASVSEFPGFIPTPGGGSFEIDISPLFAEPEPEPDIIVIGHLLVSDGGGGGGGGGVFPLDDHDTLLPGEPVPVQQDCTNTNNVAGVAPPDGAKYYLPEGVTDTKLIGALNHVSSIFSNNILNKFGVMAEIKAMYKDPSHQFFVDFKDWGSIDGPEGSLGGGTIWYYSDAAGTFVSGSAFEPFGNFFSGLLCTFGGMLPEEIYGAAAWFSESGPFWEGDDPQDTPHVNAGISAAQSWLAKSEAQRVGSPIFTITETRCSG